MSKVSTSRWFDRDRYPMNLSRPSWIAIGLATLLWANCPAAWAYKVEKVCTDIPATASDPAKRICKIVRKLPEKDAAPKEEKKEEKKKGGH
jgi:hypothetical protein